MSDYENYEDENIDELSEVKASMGDPSEVADPVTKTDNKSKVAMKGSAKAAKVKGVEDHEEITSLNLPVKESKFGMLNAMIAEMQRMSREEVEEIYSAFSEGAEMDEDYDEDSEEEAPTYSFNAEEEIAHIFNGQDLTEDFKTKAATIFEAAVASKVNEEVESFVAAAAQELEEEKMSVVGTLEEQVSSYLDYVVNEWIEQNELAVEQGIKNDIVEDFMGSMKNLFVEHYIEVPEEKQDVVEQLMSRVADLEESLNVVMEENFEMNDLIADTAKNAIFAEVTDDMVGTDAEKLREFAESIEANNAEDFQAKLETLKEHYFGSESVSPTASVVLREDFEPYVEINEESVNVAPEMQSYMQAISRNVKK
jgi:hypothetical protein